MENLLGPQDGGKAIQQNNGLLCPALLSLSQYFQLLQLPLSLHPKRKICRVLICCCGLFFFSPSFSKVDNTRLGRKPSVLITGTLQLLSTSSLHFEFNSTSFSLPSSHSLMAHNTLFISSSHLSVFLPPLSRVSHPLFIDSLD